MAGNRETIPPQEGNNSPPVLGVPEEIPGLRILAIIKPDAEQAVLKPVLGGLPVSNLGTGERIDPSSPELVIQAPEKPDEPTKS